MKTFNPISLVQWFPAYIWLRIIESVHHICLGNSCNQTRFYLYITLKVLRNWVNFKELKTCFMQIFSSYLYVLLFRRRSSPVKKERWDKVDDAIVEAWKFQTWQTQMFLRTVSWSFYTQRLWYWFISLSINIFLVIFIQ